MLELVDRFKIKLEGVLDDVVIFIDSWEYPADFIVLLTSGGVEGWALNSISVILRFSSN